jgi:hypothetical protein
MTITRMPGFVASASLQRRTRIMDPREGACTFLGLLCALALADGVPFDEVVACSIFWDRCVWGPPV